MNTSTKSPNPSETIILSITKSSYTNKLNTFTTSSYISDEVLLTNKKPATNNNQILNFDEKNTSIKSSNPIEDVNLIKKNLPFKNTNIQKIKEINTNIKSPLTNNNELVTSRIQEHIKDSSYKKINNIIESPSMKSNNKDDNLVKNNHQIVIYDKFNC